ncbi:MAG: hypothetical protein KAZ88_09845 [Acidimicrobiia bacterium]|nr:hypothetical protein [Acidimicrobiia bacterium]
MGPFWVEHGVEDCLRQAQDSLQKRADASDDAFDYLQCFSMGVGEVRVALVTSPRSSETMDLVKFPKLGENCYCIWTFDDWAVLYQVDKFDVFWLYVLPPGDFRALRWA